jgi:hypothetical protein
MPGHNFALQYRLVFLERENPHHHSRYRRRRYYQRLVSVSLIWGRTALASTCDDGTLVFVCGAGDVE